MGRLDEAGIGIGDFAKSLMESGKINEGESTPVESTPSELPVTDVDISEVPVSNSMIDQVLQESFGMGEAPKRETVKEPLLAEQEILQEKIISLREELVETINKLSSLVSEMAGISTTMGIAPRMGGCGTTTRTSKYTPLREPDKKKRRRRKRSGNIKYT
jgi:hypothetical protein